MVLDAKTGVDREPSPGPAPAAVSGFGDVNADRDGTLAVYSAVG